VGRCIQQSEGLTAEEVREMVRRDLKRL